MNNPRTLALTHTLTALRILMLRRTPNQLRWTGVSVGLALAAGIIVLAGPWRDSAAESGLLVAAALSLWALGWVVGPIQTGSGNLLRPEWFAMLPLPRSALARGLALAGMVSIGPVLTLGAAASLVVLGSRYSFAAAVVGAVAAIIVTALMVTVSRCVIEYLGHSSQSRISTEVAGLQYGLVQAVPWAGWLALAGIVERSARTDQDFIAAIPDAVHTIMRALPPGWAVVSVEAAGRGNWWVASAALAALAALTWITFMLWTRALDRRLTGASAAGARRRTVWRGLSVSGPVRAMAQRDLRSWLRDPRRRVELSASFWAAALTMVGILFALPDFLPHTGVLLASFAAVGSINVIGMDGTALWMSLLVPRGEHHDIRGRQLSWLTVFASASIAVTVIAFAVTQAWWALPSVIGLLAATLGGAAGLIPLFGVLMLTAETDAHRRSGNPAETGGSADTIGTYFVMILALAVAVSPTGLMLWWSVASASPELSRWAAATGVITGTALAWWGGTVSIKVLEMRGSDLLQVMRVGPTVTSTQTGPAGKQGTDWYSQLSTGQQRYFSTACGLSPVLTLALGVVPIVTMSNDAPVWLHEWWPALYDIRWPLHIVLLMAGIALTWHIAILWRRAKVKVAQEQRKEAL